MGGIKKASPALYDYILRGIFEMESAAIAPTGTVVLGNLEN